MAGQGEYEHDAPLHLHAMVESGEGGRTDVAARPGLADAPCQPPHLGGLDAGDLLGLLRGIIFELNLQALEDRSDLHRAVAGLDIEHSLQCGLDAIQLQTALGCLDHLLLHGIEDVEHVVFALSAQITLAQESLGIEAHEERHVRLFSHEVGFVELLLDDDLRHRKRQSRISSYVDR